MRWPLLLLATLAVALSLADARVLLVRLHPATLLDAVGAVDASAPRAQRRSQVRSELSARVHNVQRSVSAFISAACGASAVDVRPLWIVNALIVRSEGCELLRGEFPDALRWFPGVVEVEEDHTAVHLVRTDRVPEEDSEGRSTAPQANIKLLHAPELWARNVSGAGVVVGSIDSGVRYTHEALRGNFRGTQANGSISLDYAFWSVRGTEVTPDSADEVGHGTHTMGTAVGADGVGVAPGAQWIAARVFNVSGAASKSDFLEAAQWVLCPTRIDGTGENCSLGVDVLVNSFGIDRSDAAYPQWRWMDDVVQAWTAAGVVPVFASGNTNGFLCGSVFYPASRPETIAVGALMGGKSLWGASGKGPSIDDTHKTPILKPDFVAPGVAIRSALSTKDTAYTRMTGTSMATPHISGAVALLLSIKPHNDVPSGKVVEALRKSATKDLNKPFLVPSSCGDTTYKQFPNNIYGWGLANVCAGAKNLGVDCESEKVDADAVGDTVHFQVAEIE